MKPEKKEEKEITTVSWEAHGIGRRKSSIARVYLAPGTGKMNINKRAMDEYFPKATDRYVVTQPINLLNLSGRYDVYINVQGGGTSGQAGACRLGVARALVKLSPERRKELKLNGFLSRDSRKVERKKAGLRGARRRFQFSKR